MNSGRIIVVGGGLAGLTAAALLARGGKQVLLLEAAGATGGRAATRRIIGVTQKFGALERTVQVTSANGQPALILYAENGPTSVTVLDIDARKLRGVFIILNPDKLRHLGGQNR